MLLSFARCTPLVPVPVPAQRRSAAYGARSCRKKVAAQRPLAQSSQSSRLDASYDTQTRAGNLLAELLRAPQPQQRATELADQLDADFFAVASAYLAMAHKENNEEVTKDLQRVIKLAMAAKNALLRPEIRLLNDLLECQSNWLKRKQVLNRSSVPDVLRADDGYFFTLLDRMLADVRQQGPSQQQVAEWLTDIKKDCKTRLESAEPASS